MLTPPGDLSDDAVADTFRRGWGRDIDTIEYAAVGFGSHHWRVETSSERWFLTVDDLDMALVSGTDSRSGARDRLVAALSTALALRSAGYEFVVAPTPSEVGRVVEPIDGPYVLAVYPHVEGLTGSFGPFDDQAQRFAVVDLLVRLHDVDLAVPARTTDTAIPARDRLDDALGDLSGPWSAGPFAEPTRELLRRHREPLRRTLAAHDELVTTARSPGESLVVTHGEPHRGNVIVTPSGPLLIDWDTTGLAPPERDLWNLIDEDPDVRHRYEQAAGRLLDDDALRRYSLWWDLCEVALFVDDFRRPHRETDDTRTAWLGLQHHLDPARWADVISW